MKFTCIKEEILNALLVVQRAVPSKNPLPILTGIKFKAEGDKVFLTATDLEIGIRCSFAAEVIEDGESVIPAKLIIELIRSLPDLPVFIESDPFTNSVEIKYGQSKAKINGYPADEFPDFVLTSGDLHFTMPGDVLAEALRQVIFATAADENRPVFTGVLLEIEESCIHLVATDTHRLAWRKILMETSLGSNIKFIIPGKTLNELVKIIGPEQKVDLTFTENQVLFNTDNTLVISRLIGGEFPKYKMVVPGECISKIRINTSELQDATKRAALLTNEGAPIVKMQITDDTLIVTSHTEAGHVHEELKTSRDGEQLQFAFNARYLNDILKVIGSEESYIEFTGPLSPGIIKPVSDVEYISLLLPVRLRGD